MEYGRSDTCFIWLGLALWEGQGNCFASLPPWNLTGLGQEKLKSETWFGPSCYIQRTATLTASGIYFPERAKDGIRKVSLKGGSTIHQYQNTIKISTGRIGRRAFMVEETPQTVFHWTEVENKDMSLLNFKSNLITEFSILKGKMGD